MDQKKIISIREEVQRINELIFITEQGSVDRFVDNQSKTLLEPFLKQFNELKKQYPCVPSNFVIPLSNLINKGYDKNYLKYALSIIGRESSFESGTRYNTYGQAKNILSTFGVDASSGPAQMKPSTAKELGFTQQDILDREKSLLAVYKYIQKYIQESSKMGFQNKPSNVKNGSGNAQIDITIASYNKGVGDTIVKWCESKLPERKKQGLKDPCFGTNGDKSKPIMNYVPNYVDGNASTHGYIQEVVLNYKKFSCF